MPDGCPTAILWAEECGLISAFSAGHPACISRWHRIPETLEDLGRHDCLTHARSEPRNWFFRQGEGPIITQIIITRGGEANAYLMLVDLALAGAGIIRISAPMVNDHIEAGRLRQMISADTTVVNSDGQLSGFLAHPARTGTCRIVFGSLRIT